MAAMTGALSTAERSYPTSEVRGCDERSYPTPPPTRPGVVAGRSNPTPKARGGGWEDQPHVQGAVAAGAGGPRGAIPR